MAILRRRLSRIPSPFRALDAFGKGCADDGEAAPSLVGAAPETANVAAIEALKRTPWRNGCQNISISGRSACSNRLDPLVEHSAASFPVDRRRLLMSGLTNAGQSPGRCLEEADTLFTLRNGRCIVE